jgi:hypothetical protein
MSKKPDTATALAGILKAKRGDDQPVAAATLNTKPIQPEPVPPPSPAPPSVPLRVDTPKAETPAPKARGGKSSDPNYSQYSVYLRRAVRKKVGRALDDADTGQDFSELVEELLVQWLASRT